MFKWRGYVAVCAMCCLYQLENRNGLAFLMLCMNMKVFQNIYKQGIVFYIASMVFEFIKVLLKSL